jgi:hypothetical protein
VRPDLPRHRASASLSSGSLPVQEAAENDQARGNGPQPPDALSFTDAGRLLRFDRDRRNAPLVGEGTRAIAVEGTQAIRAWSVDRPGC